MSDPILLIQNLKKKFGGVVAINNFSLEIEKGQIVSLIGPNGAGKTTIFNIITGIYKPDAGSVQFMGADLTHNKSFEIAQIGIARTFQNICLFKNLSVIDNVIVASHKDCRYSVLSAFSHLGSFNKNEKQVRDRSLELLKVVGLQDMTDRKAGELPYGFQRRLEIARALAIRPKLLLLDEPAAGMNAEESVELCSFIIDMHKKFDLTIFLIEHHMDVVMRLCEQITVLNFGQTICHGAPQQVIADPLVIEAYLGEEG